MLCLQLLYLNEILKVIESKHNTYDHINIHEIYIHGIYNRNKYANKEINL